MRGSDRGHLDRCTFRAALPILNSADALAWCPITVEAQWRADPAVAPCLHGCAAGCTLAVDSDGFGISWLTTLGAFFTPPPGSSLTASQAASDCSSSASGAAATEGFALSLRQVALRRSGSPGRLQPQPVVPVVLLLGALHWRGVGRGHELVVEDLSVHLAERAADSQACLCSMELLEAAGYSRVLTEPCARVLLCDGPPSASVEVENKQLTVTLSLRTAAVLQTLLEQVVHQLTAEEGADDSTTWSGDLNSSILLEGVAGSCAWLPMPGFRVEGLYWRCLCGVPFIPAAGASCGYIFATTQAGGWTRWAISP